MDVYAWIRQSSGLRGKQLPGHFDERGVELYIADLFECGMLQRLGDTAVDPTADEQNLPWCGVLQQCVVDSLFGGTFVRRAGKNHAIVIDAADTAGFNNSQIAVDRIPGSQEEKPSPQSLLRGAVQRWCSIYKEKGREDHGGQGHRHKLLAAHPQQQACGHAQIQQRNDDGNLEGVEETQQHDAGQDSTEAGASGLEQVSRTGSDTSGDGTLLCVHPGRNYEQTSRQSTKHTQTYQGGEHHRHRTNQFAWNCLKKGSGGA